MCELQIFCIIIIIELKGEHTSALYMCVCIYRPVVNLHAWCSGDEEAHDMPNFIGVSWLSGLAHLTYVLMAESLECGFESQPRPWYLCPWARHFTVIASLYPGGTCEGRGGNCVWLAPKMVAHNGLYTPQGAEKDCRNDIGPVTRGNNIIYCNVLWDFLQLCSARNKTDLLLLLLLLFWLLGSSLWTVFRGYPGSIYNTFVVTQQEDTDTTS